MSNPNPADIPVVILCGGQGTRIREASEKLPKPLIRIGSQPILWHIMKLYGHHGYRRFILCLGYKAWDIKEYFLNYEAMMSDFVLDTSGNKAFLERETLDDWEISLIDTGLDSGTGGRIAAISHLLDAEYFMVTYGDGLGDIDLAHQLAALSDSDLLGLVTGVHPSSRYGELDIEDGIVTSFAEKPPSEGWVSGGFFAFHRSFLDKLPTNMPGHFFERAPIHQLTSERKLGLYPHYGFWMGMDTYREFTALNELWESGSAPWKVWK